MGGGGAALLVSFVGIAALGQMFGFGRGAWHGGGQGQTGCCALDCVYTLYLLTHVQTKYETSMLLYSVYLG